MAHNRIKNPLERHDIDEIFINPNKFGMPTYDQFVKNPDLWREREDQTLAIADNGSKILSRYLNKVEYEIDGYVCRTPEELERVALNQGHKLSELEPKPQFLPDSGFKGRLRIVYVKKAKDQGR